MNEVLNTVNKYGALMRKRKFPMSVAWLVAGAALGATVAYFLDPNQGSQRRMAIRNRDTKFGTNVGEVAEKQFTSILQKVESVASSMGLTDAVKTAATKAEMDLDSSNASNSSTQTSANRASKSSSPSTSTSSIN